MIAPGHGWELSTEYTRGYVVTLVGEVHIVVRSL